MTIEAASATDVLVSAGLPLEDVRAFQAARPELPGSHAADAQALGRMGPPEPATTVTDQLAQRTQACARYYRLAEDLLRRLPSKADRTEAEQRAAGLLLDSTRALRGRFLQLYGGQVYADLTDNYTRFVRAEELVYLASERYPGLVPTRAAVQAERAHPQKDKDGLEIDQGLLLADVLARPRAGAHLVQAMLRPRPEALDLLPEFSASGRLDLGTATVERRGAAGQVELRNPRFLNAEDDTTLAPLEIAIDLVLLEPAVDVGVLRGALAEHPRYAGRRVFNAGINLTHLYQGQIPFVWFITREMGFVNKLYRGLAAPDSGPLDLEATREKPWLAAVEAFAIGGGCQLLLVMDRVLAEAGSFFSLPARKEGIIPGLANMRLPRLVGDRLARQAILFDRRFDADSPAGRLLCDELVPAGEMDAALDRTVVALATSGLVSAAGNRKALRIGQEPIDLFRQYMSVYAREQAACHFSPQLVRNLEDNWLGRTSYNPTGGDAA
jgi:(3,5-dihydroxyphenyl)acetyl-CoA 1,2-dioxygenase